MCDLITAAGIALSGAGALANSRAQSKVAKARSATLAQERARQDALETEAGKLNTQSQDRYQDFGGQQDAKAQELGDYFSAQTVAPDGVNDSANLPRSSSNIVLAEDTKQRGEARDFTNKTGAALGNLRAFGDHLGSISRAQARDAGQIGQIGGFMRGSSSILPYELEAANSAGDGAKLFGDILSGAGSLATSAGITGPGKAMLGTASDPWAYSRVAGATLPTQQKKLGMSLGSIYLGAR